jgi:hypothetical protein
VFLGTIGANGANGDGAWARRLGVAQLGDPLATLRTVAEHRTVGWSLQARWAGEFPPRVRFAVRPEEAGMALLPASSFADREFGAACRLASATALALRSPCTRAWL